ncbi:MAG: RNA-binding S4 domain-containing protein [Bacteroidales bacterium]|jgi:ribosome-associated heat shock protein Hsp15|nr:RNA-binding S4 domain-containing protein [Bacteroidales bacterium]NLM91946.1 RNA-binding S4 domain-containing protein [Bacteroidales bacterium]
MESGEAPRIDKWLWAVRIFKTRSMATQACKAGKVRINNQPVKPSREVKREMVISIQTGPMAKTVKVLELLHNRVGAKLVNEYLQDLTPQEEYDKLELIKQQPFRRLRGAGRPTKKERRDMDNWLGWD